ncbi:hypothetical protein [Blastococcus sp. CT_GayMR16]|uniref:hypothetical protein n=1 Tax=Blastococcus sp. CT_GayMR16 TaxID=2559607 RepID=UPI0010746DE1|nr:hypothetical protein [Blastococcus sp. CT_GayMR16]TFV91070.1 hypothetical protein E4P38_00140 [Blastococcus sp. CT_GayMR16]
MSDSSSAGTIGRSRPDPCSPPWFTRPRGLLAVVLDDSDEARRAVTALRRAGFGAQAVKVYAGKQIIDDYRRYIEQRGVVRRMVRALMVDEESINLYLAYARDGCSAVWIRVPDHDAANRAVRHLAGCHSLHFRYFGHRRERAIILRRPTS